MQLSKEQLWHRFQKHFTEFPTLGLAIDPSRVNFPEDFFAQMESRMQKAFAAMTELEQGAIANPDEKRMVGHYWLRNPWLAPTPEIRSEIDAALDQIRSFVRAGFGVAAVPRLAYLGRLGLRDVDVTGLPIRRHIEALTMAERRNPATAGMINALRASAHAILAEG